jgi:hypothetical protein
MASGETRNWKGELYTLASTSLVVNLGYTEIFSGKEGIDMFASPPNKSTNFQRPRMSPRGDTAFEFTSKFDKLESKIDDFYANVDKLKNKGRHNLAGGVILFDIRCQDAFFDEARAKNLHIWDVRDCCLHAAKIQIHKRLKSLGNSFERELSDTVSFIWCLERNHVPGFYKGNLVLIFQEQTGEMDKGDLEKAILQVTNILVADCSNLGTFPMQIDLSILTRQFTSRDINQTNINALLNSISNEETIVYSFANLLSFFVAPWYFAIANW